MKLIEYVWKYTVHMPNKEDNIGKRIRYTSKESSDAEIEYTQEYTLSLARMNVYPIEEWLKLHSLYVPQPPCLLSIAKRADY